jgi:hypothetical protein
MKGAVEMSYMMLSFMLMAAGPTDGGGAMASGLHQLSESLLNYHIEGVDIIQMSTSLLTRTRITPEMLEKQFSYKLIIRDVRRTVLQKELAHAIESTKVKADSEAPDLRWGIIFYGPGGTKLNGIYFDKSGHRGVIDGAPVMIESDSLFEWLNTRFGSSFP